MDKVITSEPKRQITDTKTQRKYELLKLEPPPNAHSIIKEFYVFLNVHFGIILVNYQPDAQFFFFVYVYSKTLHVLSTYVLIIRRINCINTTSGICHTM
jgi:hypothetical protein